ncbi:MAG TPA: hypothetical protein VF406_16760 [Thermodesulfobacteriota bacterium]
MPESVNTLTLQFLEWVSTRPRSYADVMAAWRTACPRHSGRAVLERARPD